MSAEISDKMLITKVLISLTEQLKYFISAFESIPNDKHTISELMTRLMLEEERNINSSQVTALTAKTKFRKGPKAYICPHLKTRRHKKICYFCNKKVS